MKHKPIVVFVDHEASVEALVDDLSALKEARSMKPLSDSFVFRSIVTTSPDSQEAIIYIEDIVKKNPGVDILIMVDAIFGDSKEFDHFANIGRDIADRLTARFPSLPVGVYSRHDIRNEQRPWLYVCQRAVVLEELIRTLTTSAGMSAKDIHELFDEALKRSHLRNDSVADALFQAPTRINTRWASGQPHAKSHLFSMAALALSAKVLEHLRTIDELVLTQLEGGFSGSYVLLAESKIGENRYVIKIDEDPRRSEKESEMHSIVRTRLPPKYWLPQEGNVVKLRPDAWGAFAMHYESEARPFLQVKKLSEKDLADVFKILFHECLPHLYGKITSIACAAPTLIGWSKCQRTKDADSEVARYFNRNLKFAEENLAMAERFISEDWRGPNTLNVPWAEYVHGDLNIRNIFIGRNDVRLIDFPNVKAAPLATDFVKAEAELILVLWGWHEGLDLDLGMLKRIQNFTRAFSRTFVPNVNYPKRSFERYFAQSIITIRTGYRKLASFVDGAEICYLVLLVNQLMTYMVYRDITPTKKIATKIWIGQLAASFPGFWESAMSTSGTNNTSGASNS